MDPAVFKDSDGKYYMYFGGLWGGQLQHWKTGKHTPQDDTQPPDDKPALLPKIARMADNMVEFAEKPKDVKIVDEKGKPLLSGDHVRRFFEASWMHKYKDNYYFSYSTATRTHLLRDGQVTLRSVHLQGRDPAARAWLDEPPFDRGSGRQVVHLLSRHTALEWREPSSQREAAHRDHVQRGRHHPDHRCVDRRSAGCALQRLKPLRLLRLPTEKWGHSLFPSKRGRI
jgi:hypothetical protein